MASPSTGARTDQSHSSFRVSLSPSPAFCIKSFSLAPSPAIPKGVKIFVNIAWDPNVPPPPDGAQHAIREAMRDSSYETPTGDMFVPAIVSAPRPEKDKAGNPCLVFDCVFNSSLKSSSLKDPEFKAFLTELALQRVEAQAAVPLSRNIGTPNIRSKGPIPPRTVSIPSILYPPNHPIRSDSTPVENTTPTTGKKLIQEIQTPLPPPNAPLQSAEISSSPSTEEIPTWFWTQDDQDIRITVHVPKLTRSHISSATIDIESNRLIFCVPSLYVLDINTAATSEPPSQDTTSSKQIAGLKIQRPFAVDTARAEFRVAEGLLVVFV